MAEQIQVVYNALDNKCYAKQNGKWVAAQISQVVAKPNDDVLPAMTVLEAARNDFNIFNVSFADFIEYMKKDITQKKELISLGIEVQENLEAKIEYYNPLYKEFKADYEAKKAAVAALQ